MINKFFNNKIPSVVFIMGAVGFLMQLGLSIFYTTAGIVVAGENGTITSSTLILLQGLTESIPILMKLVSGYFMDQQKYRKTFLLLSYVTVFFCKLVVTLCVCKVFSFSPLIVASIYALAQFADRFADAIRGVFVNILLLQKTEQSVRPDAFAIRKIMASTGSILGGIISFFLLQKMTINWFNLNSHIWICIFGLIPLFLGSLFVVILTKYYSYLFFLKEDHESLEQSVKFENNMQKGPIENITFSINSAINIPFEQNKDFKDFENFSLPNGFLKITIFAALVTCAHLNTRIVISSLSNLGYSKSTEPLLYILFYSCLSVFSFLFARIHKNNVLYIVSISSIVANLCFSIPSVPSAIFGMIMTSLYEAGFEVGCIPLLLNIINNKKNKGIMYGLFYFFIGLVSIFNSLFFSKIISGTVSSLALVGLCFSICSGFFILLFS